MTRLPKPKTVELEGEYYHVRFRDPGDFSEIRTPGWATAAAGDVVEGAKVRTGKRTGSDQWAVQSVLIPDSAGKADARRFAEEILEKIET